MPIFILESRRRLTTDREFSPLRHRSFIPLTLGASFTSIPLYSLPPLTATDKRWNRVFKTRNGLQAKWNRYICAIGLERRGASWVQSEKAFERPPKMRDERSLSFHISKEIV